MAISTASGTVSINIRITGENDAGAAVKGGAIDLERLERAGKSAATSIKTIGINAAISLARQFGEALSAMWDIAASGEAANNAQRAFSRAVNDSAKALESARKATAGLVDDTSLQQRILVLDRMNLSIKDQARLFEVVTKLAVTSGKESNVVFKQALAALAGRKTALREFGIEIRDTGQALDEMQEALKEVRLEDFQTNIGRATTAWDNFVSSFEQEAADAFDISARVLGAVGDAVTELPPAIERAAAAQKKLNKQIKQAALSGEDFFQTLERIQEEEQAIQDVNYLDFLNRVHGANLQVAASTQAIVDRLHDQQAITRILAQKPRKETITPGARPTEALAPVEVERAARPSRGAGGRARVRKTELNFLQGLQSIAAKIKAIGDSARDAVRGAGAAFFETQERTFARSLALVDVLEAQGEKVDRRRIQLEKVRALNEVNLRIVKGELSQADAFLAKDLARLEAKRELILLGKQEQEEAKEEKAELEIKEIEERKDALQEFAATFQDISQIAQQSENEIVESVTKMLAALDSQVEAIQKGGPSAIAAVGKVATAGIKSAKALAIIRGLFESAAAIAAFASQDYTGGVLHLLAAGLYFATAGGGSGGASAGAAAGASAGGARPSNTTARAGTTSDGGGGRTVNVFINSPAAIIGAPTQEAGAALGRMVGDADRSGFGDDNRDAA